MNLYLISQTENRGYDTYDSAVVCAESEEAAKRTIPNGELGDWPDAYLRGWASSPEAVAAQLIGVADPSVKSGTICASYNAG